MNDIKKMLSLYFVAGSQDCRHLAGNRAENLIYILLQALESGITCFQFRDKGRFSLEQDPAAQKLLAIRCRDLCRRYGVPFIVNDDVELALAIGADGIHVGQSDMKVKEIRAKSDRTLIVGLSVNKLHEALADNDSAEIDYFGIGPIFPTQSKEDPKPAVGPQFLAELRQAGVDKPLVAIGGINQQDAAQLRALGADGVAVISAITQSTNISQTVKEFLGV
ncbi:thiamine phosphate synthase [Caviibacterium pharyngocola]|uniref:Thiamine-phosphate synthase n=1 Tax=Caviibacterium pharyngocola TaxID=28159 RepID=A0A2M8RSP9_9PAST|nr:thiamine phosphate synthase [Caviibacterium pharyngocola]PJG81903.1 thiamine phosphate synthase [Caviibacterium pharyngocola]